MLEKLAETLQKFHIQIAADNTLWLQAGIEDDQTTLKVTGMTFKQTLHFLYLGSVISDGREPAEAKCSS